MYVYKLYVLTWLDSHPAMRWGWYSSPAKKSALHDSPLKGSGSRSEARSPAPQTRTLFDYPTPPRSLESIWNEFMRRRCIVTHTYTRLSWEDWFIHSCHLLKESTSWAAKRFLVAWTEPISELVRPELQFKITQRRYRKPMMSYRQNVSIIHGDHFSLLLNTHIHTHIHTHINTRT